MLISPEELPIWMPGELTFDSKSQNWKHVRMQGYRLQSLDVPIPPLRDYLIVACRGGVTQMSRKSSGPWRSENVGPGSVSLLSRATGSHWNWAVPIEVQHLYIAPSRLAEIASDAYDRDIGHITLSDVLRADDPVLVNAVSALADELWCGGLCDSLYVEAITNQICIRLLRNYVDELRERPKAKKGLSPEQRRRVQKFIDDNLERNVSLAEIAHIAGISVFYLIRQFKATFGCPPYAFLMRRRLERARCMIESEKTPLKFVAMSCGFSDQSHMTRLFRRTYSTTPLECRRIARA